MESDNDGKNNDDKDGKTDDKQTKRQKKSEEETLRDDNVRNFFLNKYFEFLISKNCSM